MPAWQTYQTILRMASRRGRSRIDMRGSSADRWSVWFVPLRIPPTTGGPTPVLKLCTRDRIVKRETAQTSMMWVDS
jgi:hypothetical protein